MSKQMFNFLAIIMLLMFTLTATVNAATDPDLVGWWKLDEGSGKIAIDSSNYGNDGTIEGSPTWVTGMFGGALEFNGTNSYINAGNGSVFGTFTNQISITFWIKTSGFNTTFATVISKGDGAWRMGRNAGGNVLHMGVNGNNYFDGTTSVTDDEWHFCAGIYDGATATIYVDNEEDATRSYNSTIPNGGTYDVLIGQNDQQAGRFLTGTLDDVRVYKRALSTEELDIVMQGPPVGGSATNPSPTDKETDVSPEVVLIWEAGTYVAENGGTHNVYFGTNFNDVNEATVNDPRGVLVSEGQAADNTTYTPGILDLGTEYFWRVDEVNDAANEGTNRGEVWSFTAEPVALKMPFENITVTVRNRSNTTDPNNTVNEYGLDPNHPDQHGNNFGSWYTTIPDANGTWIQYEFDKEYKLHDMFVWNYNHKILKFYGMKKVRIEYSLDGENWTEFTDVNEFNQATGSETYTHNTTVPFDGIIAKIVRITGLQSYNSGASIGLSEVRFTYIPVRARIPYPENDLTDVDVNLNFTWRKGREATSYKVTLGTNEDAVKNGTAPSYNATGNSYAPGLNLGTKYYWNVDAINNSMTPSIWTSNTWSFTTVEYISIDDFEDYNDDPGFEVWQTWWDGFETPGNGSQIGHNPPPYCETDIVQNGEQSVPFYYNNFATGSDKADNSVADNEFATIQNWTTNGADTLRLFYRGQAAKYSNPSPGVFAFGGEGTDIWGTSDQFRFVYKELTGNGSIVARVDSLQNTNTWAKAGVMVRNTLDANSVQAMAILNAAGTGSFQRRVKKGETSSGTDYADLGFPYWVKVTRTGNKINAYHSEDGVTWVSFEADPNNESTVTIETPGLANKIYIGLAVTSHTADVLAGATFSGVATTGTVSSQWTVAAIGDTDQAEGDNSLDKLYVALKDSSGNVKKVYAPETAVGTARWTEWQIPYTDFAGVNMSKIKMISIGVGDSTNPKNGVGLVYIDNIGYGHPLED